MMQVMVYGARRWNDKFWGSGGKKGQGHRRPKYVRLMTTIFWKRMCRFCCKLPQPVDEARGWNSQRGFCHLFFFSYSLARRNKLKSYQRGYTVTSGVVLKVRPWPQGQILWPWPRDGLGLGLESPGLVLGVGLERCTGIISSVTVELTQDSKLIIARLIN